MVLVPSTMLALGTSAPDFSLPEPHSGRIVSLSDFEGAPALLVAFLCNHCPYVQHIAGRFAEVAAEYRRRGVAVVGISSNDVVTHPADGPVHMKREVDRRGYAFPYLFDETQEVARAYRAACTPDFFLFDARRRLAYRGRFDAARPSSPELVTGRDLRAAMDAVLAGEKPSPEQVPSIGCNIKWRPGNEPPLTPPLPDRAPGAAS